MPGHQKTALSTAEQQRVGTAAARDRTLIGRDALLADLARHVLDQRLLTLTGPGGVGKTSVAQQLAARLGATHSFADGICWVDLATLSDPAALAQAIALACELKEQRDTALIETLVDALQSKRALLVLDNCEHLRAACAEICARLLAACPRLHILATSRAPLGLAAELRCPIPPLDSAAAVALFNLRATAHQPSAITQHTASAVVAICTQLDGVPLAIELAAARVALLSVTQIAARMAQSLSLLASRATNRAQRQRSLRAVLDWSYALLHADEQTLLCQLSVFAGSFDFDAVEAVCLVSAPLDALAELVDTSLVVVTQYDLARYRLHEVVRQYAAERLKEATNAHRATCARHLAWVIALAERAEQSFDIAHQDAWLARLTREHENIRSALETAEATNDANSMLRLAGALAQFWNGVSISEGRAWLARGRARAMLQPGIISVKAWNCASFLAYRQGDYEGMHRAATAALHEALTVEYAEGIAAARYRLGIYAEMKAATREAREHYQQSFDLFQELNDRHGMSQTLNGLAHVAKIDGDLAEARQYYRQGLTLARADGDRLTTALLLISLANLTLETGDLDAAEAAYAESLAHLRATEHTSYVLYAVNGLGEVARYRRDFSTAIMHYNQGLQMARALGLQDMEAQFLAHLGLSALSSGNYAEAANCMSEGLRLYVGLERTHRIAGMIHYCAYLLVQLGYPAQATSLFVAGLRAIEADDFSYLGSEGAVLLEMSLQARAGLGPADYALAVADGAAMTTAQAIELALSAVYLPQRPLLAEPLPELRVFLFGQFRVVRDRRELTSDDWVYNKTKDLLLFLLLVDSADKGEIGTALWPDASAGQLRQNFRVAIYHLRRALGRAEWITFSGGRYAFNRTLHAWVDVAAFERAVELASSDQAQRTRHLRLAAALYAGDLALGELESDLPLIRRERLHQQALEALLALGGLHAVAGEHRAAADAYRRAIALDSYAEAAQRGLMRNLTRQGDPGAALAHYQQFVTLLARELGVLPTPATAALAVQIQAGTAV